MSRSKYLLPKTIKPFLAWLDTLPAKHELFPVSAESCPLAQFLLSRVSVSTRVLVGGYNYDVGTQLDQQFPLWADHVFKVAADLSRLKWPRLVTAKQLREALRT